MKQKTEKVNRTLEYLAMRFGKEENPTIKYTHANNFIAVLRQNIEYAEPIYFNTLARMSSYVAYGFKDDLKKTETQK